LLIGRVFVSGLMKKNSGSPVPINLDIGLSPGQFNISDPIKAATTLLQNAYIHLSG